MEYYSRTAHRRAFSHIRPNEFPKDLSFISVHRFIPIEYTNKISLNIKMPKVRLDHKISEHRRQVSVSPLKNLVKIIRPKSINEEVSINVKQAAKKKAKEVTEVKEKIKSIKIPDANMNFHRKITKDHKIPEVLPEIKRPPHETKEFTDNSVYFELLGFFIKKHLDYNPLYKKIDTENKGYIDKHDLTNFFYINSVNCDIEDTVNTIISIAHLISPETVIQKNTFFSMCSAIEYDNVDDPKLLAGDNLLHLKERVTQYKAVFNEFTTGFFISRKDVLAISSRYTDESTIKAVELVVSEQIDFARMLACLPFFLWLRTVL